MIKLIFNKISANWIFDSTIYPRVKIADPLKVGYKVERIFGGIKRWFKSGFCRYVVLTKTHGQHVLEAICYT